MAVAHYNPGGGPGYLIATSTDGHAWELLPPPAFAPVGGLWDVIWTKGQFVAVGEAGAVVTSPDGLSWTLRSTSENFYSAAWTGQRFVAGTEGHVATSTDGTTWGVRSRAQGAERRDLDGH